MSTLHENIKAHYFKPGLYEAIATQLKEQGIDLNQVTRNDIAGVDEFHVRGSAVSKELATAINLRGAHVLDVGCGLGGPCRMLADEFDCITTGIDLSSEYIATAKKLSVLVNLSERTTFVEGNAVALPFADNTFDVVWTQHVQMNIPGKKELYSGIQRVLKPGGYFIYYDIFKKGAMPVEYPMPWANTADLSFLYTTDNMKAILDELGFTNIQITNQTSAGVEFMKNLIAKMQQPALPKLGLPILMGATAKDKMINLFHALQQGNLELESGIYMK